MDKRKNRLRESTDAGAGAEMRQADRVYGAQAGGADCRQDTQMRWRRRPSGKQKPGKSS